MGASIVLISASWVWGLLANASYQVGASHPVLYEYNDPQFVQACALMTVWGYCDALVQTWCYWVMTQLYTTPADLGRIVGIFKFSQSMASAISFFLSFAKLTPLAQIVVNISLFAASIPGALFLCFHLGTLPERLLP